MNIVVLASKLKEGLSYLERVIVLNPNLPILRNVLLETVSGKLKIAATNLEIGVTTFVSGKILKEGSITIPFSVFYNIVSNTTTERITFEATNNTLLLKTDNYEATLQGISASEFPIIPSLSNTTSLTIPGLLLKQSLLKILPSAHISELRPEISGVLFDYQGSLLKLVATDTFRLSQTTLHHQEFTTSTTTGFQFIVPLKTIQEVIRIFPDSASLIVCFDQNQVLFKTTDRELISRLLDGEYPDYESIIPKETTTSLFVSRDHFMSALKLVGAFSSNTNEITLKPHEGGKALSIYSAHQNLGENTYLIPIKIEGDEVGEVLFNWRYLYDGLKYISTETVVLGLTGDIKPTLLKSPTDTSYLYILMPIKK